MLEASVPLTFEPRVLFPDFFECHNTKIDYFDHSKQLALEVADDLDVAHTRILYPEVRVDSLVCSGCRLCSARDQGTEFGCEFGGVSETLEPVPSTERHSGQGEFRLDLGAPIIREVHPSRLADDRITRKTQPLNNALNTDAGTAHFNRVW